MQGAAFKFVEVAQSENSRAEQINPKNNQIVNNIHGSLHILIEVSSGLLLLQLHPFMHGINPNDRILYDTRDQKYKLVLCITVSPTESWIIKTNQNTQLLLEVLSERCKLVQRKAANVISSQIRSPTMAIQQIEDQSKSTQAKLIQASQRLGNFLRLAGNKFSQTFQKLGNHFAQKIEPGEQMQFSDTTKKIVNNSLKGSHKLLQFSQEQVSKIFHMAKNQTKKYADKAKQTQKGQEFKESGNYDKIKQKINSGLHIIYNVYNGYSDGVSQAISGFGKGSTQVVKAKYGEQAGNMNYNVVKSAKNVYNITKVPKKQLIGMFNPHKEQKNQQKPK